MSAADRLQNALTLVLVLCAVIVTGLLARRELTMAEAPPSQSFFQRVEPDWSSYAARGHRDGPDDARVVIVEFSDFQCPFCRDAAIRLDSLRAEFPEELAVVYRHAPLRRHPHAVAAALASDCAGAQGRFWEMHDELMRRQAELGATSWWAMASAAGVRDSSTFVDCLPSGPDPSPLGADTIDARRLGVRATPTLLINGALLQGAPPLDTLRAYVRRGLDQPSRGSSR